LMEPENLHGPSPDGGKRGNMNVKALCCGMSGATCISILALTVWAGSPLMGQGNGNNSNSTLLQRESFPPQLKPAVDALGSRVVKGGNERVAATGVLTTGTTQTAVSVTHEMPNKLRIDIGPGGGRTLGFDGNSPWASDQLSDNDQDLTESLGDDAAESALYGLQSGSSLRLLGERFRTSRTTAANYLGPWVDIFETISVTKQRSSNNSRQKHLVFDSNTRLLLYVRYKILRGSTPITVQTEWSGWRQVNGQSVPSVVRRRENGTEIWNLSQDQVAIGPAQADATFLHK
jgi:hypothetical protein